MPVTNTALTSGSDATNQTSKVTASITPAGNELIEVAFNVSFVASQVTPPDPTVTGNGITYTQVAKQRYYTDGATTKWNALYLYRGMAASPSAGGITVDFGAVQRVSPPLVKSWHRIARSPRRMRKFLLEWHKWRIARSGSSQTKTGTQSASSLFYSNDYIIKR